MSRRRKAVRRAPQHSSSRHTRGTASGPPRSAPLPRTCSLALTLGDTLSVSTRSSWPSYVTARASTTL